MSLPAIRRLLFPLLLCALSAQAEGSLPPQVRAALARAKLPSSALSVHLVELRAGARARLSLQAHAARNPASLMKLVTTVVALDTLGSAFTWRTPVYLDGTVRDGTLHGNLYIRGQGDPKLVVERLWLLLRRVQSLGIHTIAGDIVLDQSAFEALDVDPGEFDGERYRPYNVAPAALLLNFKSVVMTFVPDARAGVAHVHYDPPLAGVQMQPSVPLTEGHCNDYRGALRVELADPSRIGFAGSFPAACGEKVWPLAYADPDSFNRRAIVAMWQSLGGALRGTVREGAVDPQLSPMFEMASPPLTEVVHDINKYSNNMQAQLLFLTLSQQQHGTGTLADSRLLVQDWWRRELRDVPAPVLSNGSGLSRDDRISAYALARLLQHAWSSPVMPELAASLPLLGRDGTLKRVDSAAAGRAHLKTGSLRNVVGVAGYVHGMSGRHYVLVALVNHGHAAAARPALQSLVEWAVQDR